MPKPRRKRAHIPGKKWIVRGKKAATVTTVGGKRTSRSTREKFAPQGERESVYPQVPGRWFTRKLTVSLRRRRLMSPKRGLLGEKKTVLPEFGKKGELGSFSHFL